MTMLTWQTRFYVILKITSLISIEPFLFLIVFGYAVRLASFQSLLIDRSCKLLLNYSEDVCTHLNKHKDENTESLRLGNNLYVGFVMISSIPASFMSTFLGPWSDIYGRRYTMFVATAGILASTIIDVIITASESASPTLFLTSAAVAGFSGGQVIALSQTYSYLTDITTEKNRTTRLAVLEFFFIMATPLGNIIGGQVYKSGGYTMVMSMAPLSIACALLWIIFIIKDVKPRRKDITRTEMLRDLIRFDNVKESFKTCTTPRPGNFRLQIWLLVFISCSVKIVNIGSTAIGFPFAKAMYEWDVTRYSYASTIFSLFSALATITLIPLITKIFRIHEAALGIIGILSLMAKMIVMAVAFEQPLMYYAWFSGALHACGHVAVRSRMSKIVSLKELAPVFSLLATCESITPVAGTVSMTQIFNSSVHFFAGMAFLSCAIMLIPSAIIFWWMMRMPTMSFSEYLQNEDAKKMKEMKNIADI